MAINWKIRKAKDVVDNARGLAGEQLGVVVDPTITPVEQDIKAINQVGDVKLDMARTVTSFSVTGTSQVILRRNINRVTAAIVNDSANTVYISFGGPAALNSGIRLNANGGSIVLGLATDIPYTGDIYAIATASPSVVTVTEV